MVLAAFPEPVARWRPTRPAIVTRLVRCLGVSLLTTALSAALLATLSAGVGLAAWVANLVATGAGTAVSYRLNRRWVWDRRARSDPWREVLPFWVLSFAGLALSTLLVAGVDAWAAGADLTGAARTAAVLLASVGGYALLWGAQFLLLDRVLFVNRSESS